MIKTIKHRWGINSNIQLLTIFLVFGVTGSLSAYISQPLLNFIGIDRMTISSWLYWPIRILIIFPVYQILIVAIGTLFGQFRFFWEFEKKMLARLGFKI